MWIHLPPCCRTEPHVGEPCAMSGASLEIEARSAASALRHKSPLRVAGLSRDVLAMNDISQQTVIKGSRVRTVIGIAVLKQHDGGFRAIPFTVFDRIPRISVFPSGRK